MKNLDFLQAEILTLVTPLVAACFLGLFGRALKNMIFCLSFAKLYDIDILLNNCDVAAIELCQINQIDFHLGQMLKCWDFWKLWDTVLLK